LANKFDNIKLKKGFLDSPPKTNSLRKKRYFLERVIKRYLRAIVIKTKLQRFLIDSGLDYFWFKEFSSYWSKELEGRPLQLQDFHYLLGSYRSRFQNNETTENASVEDFLESYQNDDCIYMLFGAVRRYAYEPFSGFKVEKYLKNNDNFLEYGCGYAPITEFICRYSNKINIKLYIADINQINNHYARWRLPSEVNFISIKPYKDINLDNNSMNLISLMTVMEHLPDPLKVVKNLTRILKKGGYFIFDYILGDGDGQDTLAAIRERPEVLNFIKENYELIDGKFLNNKSMGTTVCRKL